MARVAMLSRPWGFGPILPIGGIMEKQKETIEYRRLPDGVDLRVHDARELLDSEVGRCKVLRHEASVSVRYLVELPNGERRWVKGT